ncbi:MAG: cell division protein FtsA [Bacteroidetes bacterium]|nr:MAG: cell division protein FtsA [Bacteroidota bacterium]
MNPDEIAVGLDIGTTKIVAMIGRKNQYNKLEIIGIGKARSQGVQRGVVTNIVKTIESIKEAVEEAEMQSGINVSEVVVGIAGQHIRSTQHSDYINRQNADAVIDDHDLKELIDNVHNLVMLPGEEIIHVLPQEYKIDGQPDIREPKGMYGSRLEANFHIVVGQISSIKNIGRCVRSSDLKIASITLEPLASAQAVLSQEEKEAGVVLVDIGGGTTDVAIFKDGIIRHTAVIPFGGNVITEDIKEGCTIIEKQAELLKIKFGSAWPGENKENEIVSIPGLRGREPKEISMKMLSKIINARVVEIIEQVYVEIKNYGYNENKKKLIAGIVLTGGGSQLKHIKQLVEFVTGMDTRIGYPNEHLASPSSEELTSPAYATAVGLILEGLESQLSRRPRKEDEEDIANAEAARLAEEAAKASQEKPVVEENPLEMAHPEEVAAAENLEDDKKIDKKRGFFSNNVFETWANKIRNILNEDL